VAVEREIDFFDSVALGTRTERRFSAGRPAAEQDGIAWIHFFSLASLGLRS